MKHLIKYTEWESNGIWFCTDLSDLGNGSNTWWYAPRMLKMSLTDFIYMIKDKYKADYLALAGDNFIYGWTKQADMRVFKNWFNAQARKLNFLI